MTFALPSASLDLKVPNVSRRQEVERRFVEPETHQFAHDLSLPGVLPFSLQFLNIVSYPNIYLDDWSKRQKDYCTSRIRPQTNQ